MIEILAKGVYWTPDENNYIFNNFLVTDMHPANIDIANYLIKTSSDYYKDNLHSVYVRGTILTEKELLQNSDKDFVIILNDNNKFLKFVQEYDQFISILESSINFDVALYNNNNFDTLRKFQSKCIYGEDISINKLNFDYFSLEQKHINLLIKDIRNFLTTFEKTVLDNDKNSIVYLQKICKRILRFAMLKVAQQVRKYSKDLYYCCVFYEQIYPTDGQIMFDVLNLYLNPLSYQKSILHKSMSSLLK